MSPHISIKGETVFEILGFPVTNSFLVTIIVIFLFSFIARYYYQEIQKKDRSLGFYALHSMFIGMYGMFESVLRSKVTIFYSLLGSFFFFILMANWSGLIPGVGSILISPQVHGSESHEEFVVPADDEIMVVQDSHKGMQVDVEPAHEVETSKGKHLIPLLRGGTSDLNTTVALALVSVFMTQLYGFKFLGPKKHLLKYFDFRDPIMLMLGPLEIIQELARIISFGFRLYGNIFAGEVLLTIVPFLLPVFFSFISAPLFLIEVYVGLVQALVFVMLSAVFINMAVSHH